jgi:hypothetical protein
MTDRGRLRKVLVTGDENKNILKRREKIDIEDRRAA